MRIERIAGGCLDRCAPWSDGIIMVMPTIDPDMAQRCSMLMATRAGEKCLILVVNDTAGEGFIRICNQVFRNSLSDYFGYVAQDAYPGRLWLKLACRALERGNKALLAFNDGKWHGLLASFGLVRREWASRNYGGDLFYPGYKRHYADAELTLIAKNDRLFCHEPRSVLVEVDWDKDRKAVDADDKQLFRERAETMFGGRVSDRRYCRIFH